MGISSPEYLYRMGHEVLGETPLCKLLIGSLMKSSAELPSS